MNLTTTHNKEEKAMRTKKAYVFLTTAWATIIFYGSMLSSSQVTQVLDIIATIGIRISHIDFHIFEFAVFSLFITLFLKKSQVKYYHAYGFLLTLLYIVFDYIHQLFNSARTSTLLELWAGTLGNSIMIITILLTEKTGTRWSKKH